MDPGVGNYLLLAAILGGIALYGLRICHPARRRPRTVLFFVFGVLFVPSSCMGIGHLLYLYQDVSPLKAWMISGVLSFGVLWMLRRTIRRPPRRSQKSARVTVEPPAPGV